MEDSTRTQLILSAVGMTGPVGDDPSQWQADVKRNLSSLVAMTAPQSVYSRQIEEVSAAKVFAATVLDVKKEGSSTRGVATLQGRPSKYAEDGVEQVRTDRTDTPEGLAMARTLRGLKGHRVMLWVYLEEFQGKSGHGKVRVVKHVEDLGEDRDVMANLVAGGNAA